MQSGQNNVVSIATSISILAQQTTVVIKALYFLLSMTLMYCSPNIFLIFSLAGFHGLVLLFSHAPPSLIPNYCRQCSTCVLIFYLIISAWYWRSSLANIVIFQLLRCGSIHHPSGIIAGNVLHVYLYLYLVISAWYWRSSLANIVIFQLLRCGSIHHPSGIITGNVLHVYLYIYLIISAWYWRSSLANIVIFQLLRCGSIHHPSGIIAGNVLHVYLYLYLVISVWYWGSYLANIVIFQLLRSGSIHHPSQIITDNVLHVYLYIYLITSAWYWGSCLANIVNVEICGITFFIICIYCENLIPPTQKLHHNTSMISIRVVRRQRRSQGGNHQ